MRTRSRMIGTSDAQVEYNVPTLESGIGIRVIVDGCWGFAATRVLNADSVRSCAESAVQLARSSATLVRVPVTLADEPVHLGHWESPVERDPFQVSDGEVIDLLTSRDAGLMRSPDVRHADSSFVAVEERSTLATSSGTLVTQRRVRVQAESSCLGEHDGLVDTMRTTAPPTARGWEYVLAGWNWDEELTQLPTYLAEKLRAPSVEPGPGTIILDPTNLWLTIHESVGHATELDRALGYEANYAGTSFATPDQLGTLEYGSPLMNITGDRTAPHGLATVGWDDEGVAAQEWDIVRDGVLVGYQLDRAMAGEFGFERSNGCAYADSPLHTPIQRMPNVSLRPGNAPASVADLIAGVEDGFYIVGDKSWSIDMQRYNFQFTGQRFYRVRHGRIAGQVRDLAYQSRTPDFWGSLVAIVDSSTYLLGGALNCGKAQPGQVAAVSHGCPAAVFENVTIINAAEAG